jgi:pimeloyl-ACP methyl ester carboxylesterase
VGLSGRNSMVAQVTSFGKWPEYPSVRPFVGNDLVARPMIWQCQAKCRSAPAPGKLSTLMTDHTIARDNARAAWQHPEGAEHSASETLRRFFVGTFVARPWFDHATLFGLKHMFFPGSRAWAASAEAGDDYAAFYAAIPLPIRHEKREKLTKTLVQIAEARSAATAIESAWANAFFGPETRPEAHLRALEAARLTARHAYNSTRWGLRLQLPSTMPRAKLAIETPEAVEAVHGGGLAAFDTRATPPATFPAIEQSRAIQTVTGRDFWLRFRSPSARLGDVVYAHVSEPHDANAQTPTLIFGHGVCVDFDHWKGLIDESQALAARGFRIIRPEAPWHGRRAPLGYFGGERQIGTFPMGLLDSFTGALQEWAVLSDWARKQSKGALVFGGSSLGAMTSQLAADRSHTWAPHLRPDALFLVTHTGDMAAAVMEGALANLWASPEVVKSFGWTPELARKYLTLVNPVNTMPMRPENIVSILGRRDVILPFESGRQLVARWSVPERSAFIWDRGHFSVPAMLIRNTAPLDRICDIAASYR